MIAASYAEDSRRHAAGQLIDCTFSFMPNSQLPATPLIAATPLADCYGHYQIAISRR